MRKISFVQRDVLDADDPLVGLELGDAVNEQKRIAVRQNALDRAVIERQGEGTRQEAFSIIRSPHLSMSTQPSVRPPSDTELLSTLFDLGRQAMSVIDFEELLAKIPQLIARLT